MITSLIALAAMGCGSATPESTPAPLPAKVTAVTKQAGGDPTGPTGTNSTTNPVKADPPAGSPPNPTTVDDKLIEEGLKARKKPYNAVRLYQLDELQVVKLVVNKKSYYCYVMDTESKMMEGCMHLEKNELAEDEAMIFAYPKAGALSFWMKNTRIDLDIMFLSDKKVGLNGTTMKAYDETGVPSKGNAMYAVEFRAGVMKKDGLTAGMKFEFANVKFKLE